MKSKDSTDPKRLITLLVSILLIILVYPFVDERPFAPALLEVLFSGVLLSALFSVATSRRHLIVAIALVVPSLVLRGAQFWQEGLELETPAQALGLASLGFVSWVILRDCLRSGRVTTARICGVLAVYMLLGLMWASVYSIVEHAIPGSFKLPSKDALTDELVYFSFVTLTTLGYGDTVPLSAGARGLAIVEALCGQLYLAVIVARLVAMHISAAIARVAIAAAPAKPAADA